MFQTSQLSAREDSFLIEIRRRASRLHQVKTSSRWIGLTASLQSSTSDQAYFLKRWSAIEESHSDLLAKSIAVAAPTPKSALRSPLHLSQDILQQDRGGPLSALFFHSLVGLKQWELDQAIRLQQQAHNHSEPQLLATLKKISHEDEAMAREVIQFCRSGMKKRSQATSLTPPLRD